MIRCERHSAIRGFRKALVCRRPPARLLVHSGRGIQYASSDYRAGLKRQGCVQGINRKGNCWDIAVAESFFHTLKIQFIRRQRFTDHRETELALFQYLEAYYNGRRRHSSNGWMPPVEFEKTSGHEQSGLTGCPLFCVRITIHEAASSFGSSAFLGAVV